jgi:hypothetical protein
MLVRLLLVLLPEASGEARRQISSLEFSYLLTDVAFANPQLQHFANALPVHVQYLIRLR